MEALPVLEYTSGTSARPAEEHEGKLHSRKQADQKHTAGTGLEVTAAPKIVRTQSLHSSTAFPRNFPVVPPIPCELPLPPLPIVALPTADKPLLAAPCSPRTADADAVSVKVPLHFFCSCPNAGVSGDSKGCESLLVLRIKACPKLNGSGCGTQLATSSSATSDVATGATPDVALSKSRGDGRCESSPSHGSIAAVDIVAVTVVLSAPCIGGDASSDASPAGAPNGFVRSGTSFPEQ
jgi:hypothetical protein